MLELLERERVETGEERERGERRGGRVESGDSNRRTLTAQVPRATHRIASIVSSHLRCRLTSRDHLIT